MRQDEVLLACQANLPAEAFGERDIACDGVGTGFCRYHQPPKATSAKAIKAKEDFLEGEAINEPPKTKGSMHYQTDQPRGTP